MSTAMHLHRAINSHARALMNADSDGQTITNPARIFCVRRLIRLAARRANVAHLGDSAEARALQLLAAGASAASAITLAKREIFPRNTKGGAA